MLDEITYSRQWYLLLAHRFSSKMPRNSHAMEINYHPHYVHRKTHTPADLRQLTPLYLAQRTVAVFGLPVPMPCWAKSGWYRHQDGAVTSQFWPIMQAHETCWKSSNVPYLCSSLSTIHLSYHHARVHLDFGFGSLWVCDLEYHRVTWDPHLTNDFSLTIQILKKIRFAIVQLLFIRWQQFLSCAKFCSDCFAIMRLRRKNKCRWWNGFLEHMLPRLTTTWWRHQMEAFAALLAPCTGNSPVNGEFPSQRPVTRNFDVFFELRLNKRLSKQSWGWWLWHHRAHYDVIVMAQHLTMQL